MKTRTFNAIRQLVYNNSGIALSENKISLVSSRLQKRLRKLQLETYEEYLDLLKSDGKDELVEFLNVISTNTTHFFRESIHFEYYAEILNNIVQRGQKRIRVWCAASSTGEEPYTLAMCFREHIRDQASLDFKLLATDISTNVLRTAVSGTYEKAKLNDIPGNIRFKYFERNTRPGENSYTVISNLKSLVTFKRLNLIETPYPMSGPLDIIFCRNVMIYFDEPVKRKFVEEARRLLRPGGYLFVGHSESISGFSEGFNPVKPALYVKK